MPSATSDPTDCDLPALYLWWEIVAATMLEAREAGRVDHDAEAELARVAAQINAIAPPYRGLAFPRAGEVPQ